MSDPIPLLSAHPLVGTWRDSDEEYGSSAEFEVRAGPRGFLVTGRDTADGEEFEISEVSWDGETLRFVSRMPSTDHRVPHEMRVGPDGDLVMRYTLTERWTRAGPVASE